MKEAIRQFLDREEEAEQVNRDTLERLDNFEAGGKTIDHDAVDAWLETWGTDCEGKRPAP